MLNNTVESINIKSPCCAALFSPMTEDNWWHRLSQSAQMQEATALPGLQVCSPCTLERRAYPCPNSVKYPHTATKNAMTAAIVKAFLAFGPSGSRGFFGGTGLRNFTTLSFISSSS
ncbi:MULTISPECIES: hypothetical protein [Agrobacterium tumefaciens complex]|uniref:Uncharacterized protein n=1 Tax=Agrobacterium tumefaciens TaxID=358 RepID=A0AAW8LS69_AGRTU|nr:hypothetical protein [Agrobacterium tumefaciens]MBP2533911.1 hypothetical protein [Agrobacterium tumefaciens]MBP2565195.1 hypothetical protein [Agrobacterium tumefaciens]MDP9976140.1 hypothetical protein [Agrobacterium tumefaciens]MDR6700941.1 hypothetical protein [Agrobacterium tumefaciens]UXT95918.1 hypothetical protein FY129_07300 [Agrobacterium tumefaciens]